MFVMKRMCWNNSNKKSSLINYISTTITARCEEPKDVTKKTGQKDDDTDKPKQDTQKFTKKLFSLFENDISEETSSQAIKKLKTLKLSDDPETNKVKTTQKQKKNLIKRPVLDAMKTAKTPLEYNIVKSVKKVADELGGDVNETEKELLTTLNQFFTGPKREPSVGKEKTHLTKMKKGTPLTYLKDKDSESKTQDKEQTNDIKKILSVISKVEIKKQSSHDVTEFEDSDVLRDMLEITEPLNIFHPNLERNSGAKLKIWDELEKDELKYLTTTAPRNHFDELIRWTEEGKLWHFPINNEQGMEEEAEVDFTEHVFLEELLEPWCPKSGPLRHFMELVCVGLSKNPYLKVEDKHEHIFWFRDYFENKKAILQELGALASRKEIGEPKTAEVNNEK